MQTTTQPTSTNQSKQGQKHKIKQEESDGDDSASEYYAHNKASHQNNSSNTNKKKQQIGNVCFPSYSKVTCVCSS
jgi:hypothetical protein